LKAEQSGAERPADDLDLEDRFTNLDLDISDGWSDEMSRSRRTKYLGQGRWFGLSLTI